MAPPNFPLVLGSGSPRRRDLLTEAGYDFEVVLPEVDEVEDDSIPIEELTRINARLKTEAVAASRPDAMVIGADTLVEIDGLALGKPADSEEALKMIQLLNGRTHQVFTAVCIAVLSEDRRSEFTETTDVTFKQLSLEELRHYHSLVDPLDKAGAYAAQDHGKIIIESIEGSWTNVVGLPMERLAEVIPTLGS